MSTSVSIKNISDKSRITSLINEKPLKILNPKTHTKACHIVSSNYGGGMVQGDVVELDINCEANTKTLFSTQANSRIYKSDNGDSCTLTQNIKLDTESLFVQLNDPLILQKDSSLNQQSIFNLNNGAALIYCDWIGGGRIHMGEIWDFKAFSSSTEIYLGTKPVVLDRFEIQPDKQQCTSPALFHHHTSFINLFIVGKKQDIRIEVIEQMISATIDKLRTKKQEQKPKLLISGERINDDVFIMRASAHELTTLKDIMEELGVCFKHKSLLEFNPYERKF